MATDVTKVVEAQKEARYLEFDGEVVQIVRRTVERQIKASEFLTGITKSQPVSTGLLPDNCFLFSKYIEKEKFQTITMFGLKLPPHIRHIQFRKSEGVTNLERNNADARLVDFDLAWPETLWILRFRNTSFYDCRVCCVKTPLLENKLKTEIFILPMPNQHSMGEGPFCVGVLHNNNAMDISKPIVDQVIPVMDHLLLSVWNGELQTDYSRTGINNIEDWASLTKKDGIEAFKNITPKAHSKRTLESLLNWLVESPLKENT
jgi:hypothetical protein